ncbi:GAF domain-containing protein [Fusibacter sp. 3D3]|uniref:GAF domain-containing protein n=1 Tax=Fusibacter sp. 3D3 TaxID=1048380 RepID=UPI000852A2C3|nr:GAF domain-containing protein [Fusibacter sp. 3D3]GAU78760.1 hypothetical protein F3D3_3395 [Fusibacter sp. 3D3]
MIDGTKNDYESLLSSIDFFSQNLHIEQIVEYGFSIFNALEKPEASAIYTYDEAGSQFTVKFKQGYLIQLPVIYKNHKHDDFAVRNGFLLVDRAVQTRYFDESMLDNASVSKVMPLIIDDQLYGFIISTDGSVGAALGFEFITRFNYLMNLSLEKASRYLERAKLKQEIDKRIFNLNSMSQSMRMLLSELDVKNILQLSVDVIREITTSSITSIGIYDPVEDTIKIQSYENLLSSYKHDDVFKLKDEMPFENQVVFQYDQDKDKLSEIFVEASKFELLAAEYVVLLVKDRILGFVTIGKPMTDRRYDTGLLERIKDIASIMYIAITNASQFEVITEQKEQLRLQLSVLKNTNRIIKNMNSAESMDELSDMILTTMSLTFGIESGMLVTFHGEQEQIRGYVGELLETNTAQLMALIKRQIPSEIQIHYTINEIKKAYGDALLNLHSGINCFIIAPIYINQFIEEPMGVLVITKTKQRLHETQVSMVEILANSVGPVMGQLLHRELYESHYIPRPEYEIKRIYDQYLLESELYSLDFQVYIKKISWMPFVEPDLSAYVAYDYILMNTLVIIFSAEAIEPSLYDEVTCVNPEFEAVKSTLIMLAI